MIAAKVNLKSLSCYFSFGCTYGIHLRVSIEMYVFCKWCNLVWRVEGEMERGPRDLKKSLSNVGFRLSRSKIEYMECNFKRRSSCTLTSKVVDNIIPKVTRFKYLGFIVQNDRKIEAYVNHCIQVEWLKCRRASCVLCDKKIPFKLKGKFYRTTIRLTMLYGTKCWAVKSQHENQVSVTEMRMFRERERVLPIIEKLIENRLRWFRYVERRLVNVVVRTVDQMEESKVKRGRRGRHTKTIRETIRKDLEVNELDSNMIYEKTLWRNLIHGTNPTPLNRIRLCCCWLLLLQLSQI